MMTVTTELLLWCKFHLLIQVLGQWLCSVFTLFSHLNTHLAGAKKTKALHKHTPTTAWPVSMTALNRTEKGRQSSEESQCAPDLFTAHPTHPTSQHNEVLQTSSDSLPFSSSDKAICKYRKSELKSLKLKVIGLLTSDISCERVSIPQVGQTPDLSRKWYKT